MFDPEHVLAFARAEPHHPARDEDSQKVMKEPSQKQNLKQNRTGWLHTYQTAKELRLVYIDRLSTAKSQIGTLDSQDRILLNDSIPSGGVSQETRRALTVCGIATMEWANRVDGVIRMAAGFEIILCAPERNLVPVRVTKAKSNSHDSKRPGGKSGNLLRTVTSRYGGIRGGRVVVNYDHFVSVYDSARDLFCLILIAIVKEHYPGSSTYLQVHCSQLENDLQQWFYNMMYTHKGWIGKLPPT